MKSLKGKLIHLHPATLGNRKAIFQWMTNSDISKNMFGPPLFPEIEAPSWEEFLADYAEHYFTDEFPLLGRCFIIKKGRKQVGQINYNSINLSKKQVELDIWLASSAYTGKGYGTEAIKILCKYLKEKFEVNKFLVQPSARNPKAIKAYEKVGFKIVESIPDGMEKDYYDSIILVKTVYY